MTHDQYGLGRIISTETAGQGAVLVDFGSHQVRVVQPYDKLFKL